MTKKTKKRLYLSLWLVFGALLGTLIGEMIEYFYMTAHDELLEHTVVLYAFSILVFLVISLWLGPTFWRKIYIEGVRGKKYIAK